MEESIPQNKQIQLHKNHLNKQDLNSQKGCFALQVKSEESKITSKN